MQAIFPDTVVYQVIVAGGGVPPVKRVLYRGPLEAAILESVEDNAAASAAVHRDDEGDNVLPDDLECLCLTAGDALSYPVFGQAVGRFEGNVFACPAGLDADEEEGEEEAHATGGQGEGKHDQGAAKTFTSLGFKLAHPAAADAFAALVRHHADFSDKRKCYAAKKVDAAGKALAKGVGQGAALFGRGMKTTTGFLKSKMPKATKDAPGAAVVSKSVAQAKGASAAVVQGINAATGVVALKTVQASHYAGKRINHSAYVRRLRARRRRARLAHRGAGPGVGSKVAQGVTQVAVASGAGALNVFAKLNESVDVILDESVEAVGDVVGHMAGEKAGAAAKDALGVACDGVKIYGTAKAGGKKLAKSMAKDAALKGAGELATTLADANERGEAAAAALMEANRK